MTDVTGAGTDRPEESEILTRQSNVSVPLHEAAVFLDLDGTLAPIVERPEDVGPDRHRNQLLRNLNRALGGKLAIVSGRPIDDLDRILDASIPCLAGVHGLERRTATGKLVTTPPHDQLDRAYLQMESFAAQRPKLHLEFKMLSIALHYRQAPELAAEVVDFARRLAWTTGLKLQEGRMVVELRSPGANKGDTVRAFMQAAPFHGSTPIYVGDDITDEDGFAAVRDLGGFGVLVGLWRETSANARLEDVAAVLAWIGFGLDNGNFDLVTRS